MRSNFLMGLLRRRWVSLLGLAVLTALALLFWVQRPAAPLQLQILHASDFEAGIPALEDAVGFSARLNQFQAEMPDNTLILSSGDNYILGPIFSASGDAKLRTVLGREGNGRGDIAIMNALGIQAAAWGNHEFDEGTGRIADLFVADEKGYAGANFPYLAANLDFSQDPNLQKLKTADQQLAKKIPQQIARSTIIQVQGQPIGLVGVTTPLLPEISSPGPGVTVMPARPEDLPGLAATIQPVIDQLTQKGINKIILLSHLQQLANEIQLASLLRDVDIIIAGGSHSVLINNLEQLRPGDKSMGPYPVWKQTQTREPVAIVNTGANYRYLGRLVVEFDGRGILQPQKNRSSASDAYPTTGPIAAAPNPQVVAITDALRSVIQAKDGNQFGRTTVFLNGTRSDVRTQETNLGDLTADANLIAAQKQDATVQVSLKNGGGIRDNIGAISGLGGDAGNPERLPPQANPIAQKQTGDISQLDIENALRFNNGLVLVSVTPSQLKQVLEHSVAATEPMSTPGQFPQVAGLAFSFDPQQPPGQRIQSVALTDSTGKVTDVVVRQGQVVGNEKRLIRVVTLNFLIEGGDSYPWPDLIKTNPTQANVVALAKGSGKPDFQTPGTEQHALATYLQAKFKDKPFTITDTPPELDQRIQNLAIRADTVLQGVNSTPPPQRS